MKKWIIRIVLAVVVLLVIGFIVVAVQLDAILKKSVETIGPSVTKVDVKLEMAHLSVMGGNLKLKGLLVGNPPGYKSDFSMKLGSIEVTVKPSSIFSDKVIVDKIDIEGAEMTIEGGINDNNLTKIQANVNDVVGGATPEGGQKGSPPPSEGGSKSGKKLQITDFVMNGTKVHATLSVFGKTLTIPTLTIPSIHLTNLGAGSDGVTPGELTRDVINEVTKQVIPELTAEATKVGKGALDAVGNFGKDGGDSVKKATSGLKSLFGK